jgi:hypothetical protein
MRTNYFRPFFAAISAARAVESGRRPDARDLKALGIDPESFPVRTRY